MNTERHSKIVKISVVGFVIFLILYLFLHHKTSNNADTLPLPVVFVKQPELLEMTEYVTQTR
ncbi:efflux protein [Legionella hackeliae]|uniref:hypothetical protein n=1 Tax=Legionella hackeliae TaxID=449 RepID=UPI000E14DD0A|nr:hypothetical protein [Legionella hackeliae]STX49894.1 efflux protein [Legionella hackeliae]